MGKREIRQWNLFALRGSVFFILGGMFLLGALAGCLFAVLADEAGTQELERYLGQYFNMIQGETNQVSFWRTFWIQSRYILVAWFLGSASIGVLGLPFLFGLRGCLMSFSTAVCYRVFGNSGLWLAGVLFVIPAFFWLPGLLLVGERSFTRSITSLYWDKNDIGITTRQQKREYSSILWAAGLFVLGAWLESKVLPLAFELVLQMT